MNRQYADLIKAELDEETTTTADFRSRALTIVTTSGGLVTLLSGLVAIGAGGSKTWKFPSSAHLSLLLALGFYVAAAVLALWVHLPRNVRRATITGLDELLKGKDTDNEATDAIADLHLTVLKSTRSLNGQRAWVLLLAIAAEIVAIAATGWTAAVIVGSL